MGIQNLMSLQEDPDGLFGHEEREVLRTIFDNFPVKKKFTGKGRGKSEWQILQENLERERKIGLKHEEAEEFRNRKPCFKPGCNEANCKICKKNKKKGVKLSNHKV